MTASPPNTRQQTNCKLPQGQTPEPLKKFLLGKRQNTVVISEKDNERLSHDYKVEESWKLVKVTKKNLDDAYEEWKKLTGKYKHHTDPLQDTD